MASVRHSALADDDRREIWRYIAARNLDAADKLLRRIDAKLVLYAENPRMGRQRDEIASDLRSFPVGNYVIFYRPVSGGIEVARVLHGARDINRLFKP
ncbi:MAG TPA: type II toxin-antitoxin system RelE/ParE family toxin [Tepidisphaeraceae bacterium]|nr:type II toxin-antitoxin system RelE/ParE family toxin [Tepidisphaeraceae bacterium]